MDEVDREVRHGHKVGSLDINEVDKEVTQAVSVNIE